MPEQLQLEVLRLEDIGRLIQLAYSMPDVADRLEEIRKATELLVVAQERLQVEQTDLRAREQTLIARTNALGVHEQVLKTNEQKAQAEYLARIQEIRNTEDILVRRSQEMDAREADIAARTKALNAEASAHYEYHRKRSEEIESTLKQGNTQLEHSRKHSEQVLARREQDVTLKEQALEQALLKMREVLNMLPHPDLSSQR